MPHAQCSFDRLVARRQSALPHKPLVPVVGVEDIEVGAHTISRGDLIVLSLAAANRDPAAFPEPDRLDLTRSPNPHISFGHDAHYCLGASFARLEAQIAIGTLARSVSRIRLATEEPEREDWFVVRGLKSLPIEFA